MQQQKAQTVTQADSLAISTGVSCQKQSLFTMLSPLRTCSESDEILKPTTVDRTPSDHAQQEKGYRDEKHSPAHLKEIGGYLSLLSPELRNMIYEALFEMEKEKVDGFPCVPWGFVSPILSTCKQYDNEARKMFFNRLIYIADHDLSYCPKDEEQRGAQPIEKELDELQSGDLDGISGLMIRIRNSDQPRLHGLAGFTMSLKRLADLAHRLVYCPLHATIKQVREIFGDFSNPVKFICFKIDCFGCNEEEGYYVDLDHADLLSGLDLILRTAGRLDGYLDRERIQKMVYTMVVAAGDEFTATWAISDMGTGWLCDLHDLWGLGVRGSDDSDLPYETDPASYDDLVRVQKLGMLSIV